MATYTTIRLKQINSEKEVVYAIDNNSLCVIGGYIRLTIGFISIEHFTNRVKISSPAIVVIDESFQSYSTQAIICRVDGTNLTVTLTLRISEHDYKILR